jgi:hypothetical protein
MTERELRKLIREELEMIQEAKTADEERLGDANLAIISLTSAANMLHRVGVTNTTARDMAKELDGMAKKLEAEVIPSLKSMAKGSLSSHISSTLGKLASRSVRPWAG